MTAPTKTLEQLMTERHEAYLKGGPEFVEANRLYVIARDEAKKKIETTRLGAAER